MSARPPTRSSYGSTNMSPRPATSSPARVAIWSASALMISSFLIYVHAGGVLIWGLIYLIPWAIGRYCKPGTLRLEDGERIIESAHPRRGIEYRLTLGLSESWRRANRLTITDRRVVRHRGLV